MKQCKYFIGPMSKNIVDAAIDFCNRTGNVIGLIPSRRQVEWHGGYVNNWTTNDFVDYVRSKTENVLIQRDHAGPGQGQSPDDGYVSLTSDCRSNMDLIHIDPWKDHQDLIEGLVETSKMIKFCNDINPKLRYEIGTEEAIRRFETSDLEFLLVGLRKMFTGTNIFEKIEYLVIQSGTSLKGNKQTGSYESDRLSEMVALGKKYGLLTKEHNGDYISVGVIQEKFNLGLDAINIAPEFGLIETNTYLNNIFENDHMEVFEEFWGICYESDKWKKWVNPEFDPIREKEALIKICGHYVLSKNDFITNVKSRYPGIDEEVKENVTKKLEELYG